MSQQRLQSILGFVFGTVFVVTILTLVTLLPNPTPAQYEIFRIVIALAAGGVAAVIPGLLNIQMQFGLTEGQKLAIQAGGALAVFVIVYFYSPAQALTSPTTISQSANGPCAANIANNTGSIRMGANCSSP
jgi:hypothetical protein